MVFIFFIFSRSGRGSAILCSATIHKVSRKFGIREEQSALTLGFLCLPCYEGTNKTKTNRRRINVSDYNEVSLFFHHFALLDVKFWYMRKTQERVILNMKIIQLLQSTSIGIGKRSVTGNATGCGFNSHLEK